VPIAQSRGWLVVSFAGFAGFVALTTLVALDAPAIETADTAANAAAAELARGSPWIAAARVVTWLGKTEVLAAGTALATVTLGARRAYARAGFVVTSVAVGYAVRWSVRAVLERPRPEPLLADVSNWAFPSGHAANIATVAVLATLLAGPYLRGWGRVALVTAAAATSVAVGVSRVALLVHWPSDVAGGWLLPLGLIPLLALGADRRWPGWRGREPAMIGR